MPQYAPDVFVSNRQRAVLESFARAPTSSQRLADRARIVLRSADGELCVDAGTALGVDAQRVRRWRRRWASAMGMLASAEEQGVDDRELADLIVSILDDNARSGTPGKFTAEQIAQIITLACEDPSKLGFPFTHWTPGELAREARKRKIVDGISPRHVARFFGGERDPATPVRLLVESKNRRPGASRRRGS